VLAESPKTAILMLSMHSEQTLVRQAMAAGARGYVLKSAVDLDLAGAVKRIAGGETVLDPALDRSDPAADARPLSPGNWKSCSLFATACRIARLRRRWT